MKITVITAVFNRVDTVGQAIQSVLAQGHQDIDLVVQDGGSTDGTLDVLHDFHDSRMSIVSGPDGGIYDALNRGIVRATGDVIGLMHSDDFFAHNHVLEHVADAFTDRCVDGVYGDLNYVTSDHPARVVRAWHAGAYEPGHLAEGWMPPHPTLYVRRAVFDDWGAYDTGYTIAADYDAMLRWMVTGHIQLAYLPEVMVCMRTGGASNGSLARILKKTREDYRAVRHNGAGGAYTILLKNLSKVHQFWRNRPSATEASNSAST